jgi:hypothetical protein
VIEAEIPVFQQYLQTAVIHRQLAERGSSTEAM